MEQRFQPLYDRWIVTISRPLTISFQRFSYRFFDRLGEANTARLSKLTNQNICFRIFYV